MLRLRRLFVATVSGRTVATFARSREEAAQRIPGATHVTHVRSFWLTRQPELVNVIDGGAGPWQARLVRRSLRIGGELLPIANIVVTRQEVRSMKKQTRSSVPAVAGPALVMESIAALKMARTGLKAAGARRALAKVQRALSSAEGALRHADRLARDAWEEC